MGRKKPANQRNKGPGKRAPKGLTKRGAKPTSERSGKRPVKKPFATPPTDLQITGFFQQGVGGGQITTSPIPQQFTVKGTSSSIPDGTQISVRVSSTTTLGGIGPFTTPVNSNAWHQDINLTGSASPSVSCFVKAVYTDTVPPGDHAGARTSFAVRITA
jgi:hypothetical protein